MKWSYRNVLLALSVAALLLAVWLSITSARLGAEAEARHFEQYNRQQLIMANHTARSIGDLFSTFRRALSLTVGLFGGREPTFAAARELSGDLKAIYSVIGDTPIIDLVIFDQAGTVVGIVPDEPNTLGRNYSWRGYYKWAKDEGRQGAMYLSPFLKLQGGQHRGEMAIMVAEGIYDEAGGFKGVVMMTVNFDELARKLVLSVKMGEQGYAWLLDSGNGSILVDPRGKIAGQTIEQAFLPKWPKLYEIARESKAGGEGVGWYDYEEPAGGAEPVRKLVAWSPVKIENSLWTVGVCTPQREVKEIFAEYIGRQQSFFSTLIIIAVAGGGFFLALLFGLNQMLMREVATRTSALEEAKRKLDTAFNELIETKKLAAVGQLALGLVHEVRNPLSSIRMNMQMVRKRLPPEGPSAENFRIMEDEILRLNRLLGDVMNFARPSPLRLNETNLPALAHRALVVVGERLSEAGVRVRESWPEAFPLVLCDGEQITQVVLNLLLNAAQSLENQEGERLVAVSGEVAGDFAVITVADNGRGIAPNHFESLFDPFFTTKAQGGGLGLSIARRIVQNHGGTLEADPSATVGAVFRMRLPVRGPRRAES